jgi:hypothetical protein
LAKRLYDSFGVFTYDGDTPSDACKALQLLCGFASNWLQLFVVNDRQHRVSINYGHFGPAA